jgi:hypothetical protein
MPDLWDTNPDSVFNPPNTQPDPGPSAHDDHAEVQLTDDRGKLRLPAYVLIALVVTLAAITVSIVAALVGFS